MEYSTFYDESSLDVSGLPDMPSLVRIDREAIQLRTLKIEKLDITKKDNLKTAITGNSLIFVSCIGDRSLVRFDTETSTVDFFLMSEWMDHHGDMCQHGKKLAAYVECTYLGNKKKGIAMFDILQCDFTPVHIEEFVETNTKCLGLCSSNGELFTTVVENDVLFLRIQKTVLVSHIPISCVPREETIDSMVSGICSSDKGIIFISDSGRNQVYRVDTQKKNCTSFGADVLDGPVDVTIWGDYLLVLDADSVAIFTPMGLVIKKCRITMNGQPVSLKKLGEMLIITSDDGYLTYYDVKTD